MGDMIVDSSHSWEGHSNSRSSWLVHAGLVIVVSVGVALSTGAWQRQRNLQDARDKLGVMADAIVYDLTRRMATYEYGLRGMRGAVVTAGGRAVTREQVLRYSATRDVDQEFPGAHGYGVIWRVPAAQQDAFVDQARRDGWPDFSVRQLSVHADERYVITYIEPAEHNRAAVGLDVASERHRRAAAEAAMRTGVATLTAPITLVQKPGRAEQSFLLLLPIYRPGAPLATVAQREQACLGWSYTPLVTEEVMAGLKLRRDLIALRLNDLDAPMGAGFFEAGSTDALTAPHWTQERRWSGYGRRWSMAFSAGRVFADSLRQTPPWQTGALCGTASMAAFLIGHLFLAGARRARHVRWEQARRAAMVDSSDDAIIGESLDGHILEWNAGAQRLFGYTAAQALGQTVTGLLLPEDLRPEDAEILRKIRRGERVAPYESLRRHQEGFLIDVSVSAVPILGEDGQPAYIAKTLRDIREIQKARHELAQHNEALERLVSERTETLAMAQRENAGLLKTINEHAIVSITDRTGRIISVNPGFCKISGYSAEELTGQNHRLIRSGMHPPGFWRDVWRTISQGASWHGEVCNRAKDGSLYWVDSVIAPFLGADGRIEKYVSIRTDITPIKSLQQQAEKARHQAEEAIRFLRDVTDRLPLRIGYLDTDLRYRFVNEAQCLHLAATREALIGQPYHAFAGQFAQEPVQRHLDIALKGESSVVQHEEASPNGAPARVHELRVVPDMNAAAEVMGVFLLGTDITERLLMEGEQRSTLTVLRAVLDASTQAAIIATGAEGIVRIFNRGAERMLGYASEEVVGQIRMDRFHDADELLAMAAELSQLVGHEVAPQAVLTEPGSLGQARDWTYRRKDGGLVPVSLAVTEMRDDTEHLAGYLAIAHDITSRYELEASLRRARDEANRANLAKSQFLANMSHEIRTPLNAVVGFSNLLGHTPLVPEQAGLVSSLKTASLALLSLINDVLDVSKIEAGEMTLEQVPFSLHALLAELDSLFGAQARAKGLAFSLNRPAELPDGVHGDPVRIRQVLTNLLGNAIKFTQRGEVLLQVESGGIDPTCARITFRIRDTGVGIPPEALSRLFRPFVQADESTTRRFGGTGLGLALVKQFVDMMNGQVHVSSTLGGGSEFVVELPMRLGQLAATAPDGRPAGAPARDALKGVRVLVVDDSLINLEVAQRLLEAFGASTAVASSGAQCLEYLASSPEVPDIVLMDIQMPELDGVETTCRIREELGLRALPIVALTAAVTRVDLKRATDAGMREVVAKPFDPLKLVTSIRRHVGLAAAAAPADSPEANGSSPPTSAWPVIPGIDTEDACRRLVGDVALFRVMLRRLFEEIEGLQAAAPDAPGSERAARMHRIRGNAGTLGAKEAERSAGYAEAACVKGDLAAADHWVTQLLVQLWDLRRHAHDFLNTVEPEAAGLPVADVAVDLPRLLNLLKQQDLDAVKAFKPLEPYLRSQLGPAEFGTLQAHIDNLRFEAASAILQPLG